MSKNKLALVTGGLTGIGKGIGLLLKKHGYTVVANYPPFMEVDSDLILEQDGLHTCQFDVSDLADVQAGIARITKDFGVIDVLVNNAGIIRDCFLHKMDPKQWADVLNTNLNSVFYCSHSVIKSMREQKFGRIINMTSVNAVKGQAGQTNYCAAKAGIIGFTKALAQESARCNITVNCIAPGYIDTTILSTIKQEIMDDMILPSIPVKRLGSVDDIAKMACYLIEKGDYITGQVMHVNGGLHM